MKQRFSTHTTLIELTLSLLFLMLATMTILGLFMTAHDKSAQAGRLTRAVQAAQNSAALIQASVDPKAELEASGFMCTPDGRLISQTADGLKVCITMREEHTSVGNMFRADVEVLSGDESLLEWPILRYYNKEVIHP